MKTLVISLTLMAALLLALVSVLASMAQEPMACEASIIPTGTQTLIGTKFNGWRPKRLTDLGADDQELWKKAHKDECPGIFTRHLESADRLAYVVLLVPKSDPTGGYKVVVLEQEQPNGAFSFNILDHSESQTYSGLVISSAPPVKYSDFDGMKSVEVKLNGIYVEWLEKGTQLYYWSGGRYHKIQISD